MFDASYLIAEFAEGSCLVDIVHPWEMNRLVRGTSVVTRWEEGFVLRIDSTRVIYDEPDEGEAEEEPRCERLSYRVRKGALRGSAVNRALGHARNEPQSASG